MKQKTVSPLFGVVGVLIIASALVTAFASNPSLTADYVQATKASLRTSSVLFSESLQQAVYTDGLPLKGNIEAISVGNEKTEVVGCFDLPDNGPWDPDATLIVNGGKFEWAEFKLLNPKDPATYASSHRCYVIGFPYAYEGKGHLKVRVSVSLTQEVNRGLLDVQTGKKIGEKIQQKYPEFDFDVVTESGEYGGGTYIVFNSKPAGMSDDEAFALINEAMIEKRPGSWNFDIEIP